MADHVHERIADADDVVLDRRRRVRHGATRYLAGQ
jgi:hypothetical protein